MITNAEEMVFFTWFTPEFLQKELERIYRLFWAHDPNGCPRVTVMVASESPSGEAAISAFAPSVIVMYADYHRVRPQEYKATLLHELGHFIYSKDHSMFHELYRFLKFKQEHIEEKIVPDTYEDFLYCTPEEEVEYTYACGGCGDRTTTINRTGARCSSCDTSMLLVAGL